MYALLGHVFSQAVCWAASLVAFLDALLAAFLVAFLIAFWTLPVLLAVLLAAFPGCRAGYLYPWSLAILAVLWLSFWLHFSPFLEEGPPCERGWR